MRIGNEKLSELRMQLLKTGVIKLAIMSPTELDGVAEEMCDIYYTPWHISNSPHHPRSFNC